MLFSGTSGCTAVDVPRFRIAVENKVERPRGLRRSFRGYLSEGQLNERAEGRLSLMASTYPRDNLLRRPTAPALQ